MDIVILEKDTLTVGDMDFSAFEKIGKVHYYDTLSGTELYKAVENAEIVLINKTQFSKELFSKCKKLRYIGIFATGYNNVDLDEAKKRGVTVCNAPSYSTSSVAQLTFSFILELSSNLSKYDRSTKDGNWIKSETFSYFPFPFVELKEKTLGIFGMGEIGEAVANIGLAFGMKVLATTRTKKFVQGVTFVDREQLFKESDFLTIHCPLTKQTEKLVNQTTLALMKPTAFLINTSRGGVIDEYALSSALKNKTIKGAALDVLTKEPMDKNCPLWGLDNCIITPHIAWTTVEARTRLLDIVAKNLQNYLDGKPQNTVV